MDQDLYLKSMGNTASQRAFFSYMAQPQGSYSLHMIFRQFLKQKRIVMQPREQAHWKIFLADYVVFRLYIARYVLKEFAGDYTPLLHLYQGFDEVDEHFPELLIREADPGRGVGDISLLPEEPEKLYPPEKIRILQEKFTYIAEQSGLKGKGRDDILKHLVTEGLSYLAQKDKVPLYTPIFWFFAKETLYYARYLTVFYKGLIPASHYETVHARPVRPSEEEEEYDEDPFYKSYRLPAMIFLFLAGLICVVLAQG